MDRDQPQGSSQATTSAANPQTRQQEQQAQPVMSAESSTQGGLAPPAPPKTEADRVRSLSYQQPEGTYSAHGSEKGDQTYGRGGIPSPAQARSREGRGEGLGPPNRRRVSGLDWIIPAVDGGEKAYTPKQRTVGERLDPTVDHARREKAKYELKAMWNGYLLNFAIGLQVLLGALVTGISAAIDSKKVGLVTSILGGASTIVASYLARMRGTNEPSLSIQRSKDLDQFIRQCEAFLMDHGHKLSGEQEDAALQGFRDKLEQLLGNADNERKMSPA